MATMKDAYPRKDFSAIVQVGLKAHNLAGAHQAALEPRLPSGLLDGLAADLTKLGGDVPGAQATRAEARAATASQDEALAQGYALVTAIRTAVQRSGASKDVRVAYGVGVKTSARVVKQVKAAILQIVERANSHPAEASALGILSKDVTALEDDLATITSADDSQEQRRAGAPQSTKERNRTANRILGAVDRVVAAGVVEFAKAPETRAEFEALVAGSGGGTKKAKQAKQAKKAAAEEEEKPAKP